MGIIKLLLISSLVSLLLGQLIRLPLFSEAGAVTPTDIFVLATDLVFLVYFLTVKKSLKLPVKIFIPVSLFILSAFLSTFLALTVFSLTKIIISLSFLARFIIYFFLSIVVFNTIQKKQIQNWINLFIVIGSIFVFLGLVQFFAYPDLSFLASYGWDPHQKRVITTLLDPNFSGLIFSMLIAFSVSLYLYQKKNIYFFVALFSFIAQILTFSRSSYLATLTVMLLIGLFKSPKVIFATLIFFILAFSLNTKVRSRITGAFTLDETSMARIESWQKGLTVFKSNFLFGVGFNTYRYAQENYGFFTYDNPEGGHSGSGIDSSLLLVAATTGVIGLGFFLLMLFSIFQMLVQKVSLSYLHLATLASFLGLLIHSQFVNSFFFPQIMMFFWFFLGLILINDS